MAELVRDQIVSARGRPDELAGTHRGSGGKNCGHPYACPRQDLPLGVADGLECEAEALLASSRGSQKPMKDARSEVARAVSLRFAGPARKQNVFRAEVLPFDLDPPPRDALGQAALPSGRRC